MDVSAIGQGARLARILGLAALVAAACATGKTPAPAESPTRAASSVEPEIGRGRETGGSVPHAVEAAHLREMMAELDYLATALLPDDVESASEGSGSKRAEVFGDIEHAAVALAGTAADIPDVLAEVRLSAEDRAHFRALADQLRANALDLQERAARREAEPAKQALARITSTCDACHKAFRVLPNAAPYHAER